MTKEYTLDYQYEMNIVWFFMGENNTIAQFSTGGAILPDIVAKNAEDNQILTDFFDSLSPSTEVRMNPLLNKYYNIDNLRTPLSQYSYYAQRGLISFDKTNAGPGTNDINYHLIAHPVEGLNFHTLPDKIKDILLNTRQPINFKDFYKIDEGYIPWASLFTDYYVPLSYEPKPGKKKGGWSLFR